MIWFKFYALWGTGMQELSDAEAGRFIKALCTYAETGETVSLSGAERVLFTMALKQLKQDADHSAKISSVRAEAGRAGGLSSKQNEANESNCLQNEANIDNCSNKELRIKNKELRDVMEVKESVLKNARDEKPAPKHKHGFYKHVLLTDAEVGKLAKRFPDWEKKIQNLDDYLQNNKKKHYDDHYLTICKWADNDAEKAKAKAPQAQAQPESWIELADRIMAADGILGGGQ